MWETHRTFNEKCDRYQTVDLRGQTKILAEKITLELIQELRTKLITGEVEFNEVSYHVFVINAHAGWNSYNKKGVLKHAIYDLLVQNGWEEDQDFHYIMKHG
jgi:hypothetical protein